MHRVEKRTPARLDLIETWGYVATEVSPEVADKLLDRIGEKLMLLAENPGMGRSRPDIMEDLRSFPVASYNVYYMPLPERAGIEAVRILHQRKDISDDFEE